jgi:hypothetical protein
MLLSLSEYESLWCYVLCVASKALVGGEDTIDVNSLAVINSLAVMNFPCHLKGLPIREAIFRGLAMIMMSSVWYIYSL